MSKQKALKVINDKIDALIIAGKTHTPEYQRLVQLHFSITQLKKPC